MKPYKTRAVMFDPARLMEKMDYYMGLLPWLKEWGYNLIHMHVTDDQGCAVVFPSHPELASKHAFTAEEMRAFIDAAAKLGIQVMPELESLGHTRFITRHKNYRHLGGPDDGGFNAIDPDQPDTRVVLRELLQDTAEMFDCELLHVGLDEVNFKVLPKYSRVPESEHWRIFARHAAWVHGEVRRLGKRPAMWGDHVLHSPDMAKKFGSDVLMVDWHYHIPLGRDSLDYFAKLPFEFWGGPATVCYSARITPNHINIGNLREFSAKALSYRKKGLTGMVNTVWCPWRNLPGVIDMGVALGGHLFSEGEESPDFGVDFCKSFYGLTKPLAKDCARNIWEVYMSAPARSFYERVMSGNDGYNVLDREDVRMGAVYAEQFPKIAKEIAKIAKKAKRHSDRLGDVALSARAIAAVGERAAAGCKGRVKGAGALSKAYEKAWGRDRWLDEPRLKRVKKPGDRFMKSWPVHGLRKI